MLLAAWKHTKISVCSFERNRHMNRLNANISRDFVNPVQTVNSIPSINSKGHTLNLSTGCHNFPEVV